MIISSQGTWPYQHVIMEIIAHHIGSIQGHPDALDKLCHSLGPPTNLLYHVSHKLIVVILQKDFILCFGKKPLLVLLLKVMRSLLLLTLSLYYLCSIYILSFALYNAAHLVTVEKGICILWCCKFDPFLHIYGRNTGNRTHFHLTMFTILILFLDLYDPDTVQGVSFIL